MWLQLTAEEAGKQGSGLGGEGEQPIVGASFRSLPHRQLCTHQAKLASVNILLFASDYHHDKKNYLEGIKESGISFPILSSPSSEASNGKICMYFFLIAMFTRGYIHMDP